MVNNYGAFSELPKPRGNDYGAYLESRPSVYSKSPKTRKKSSDTSSMNSLYKPKASPGPIGSASNVREGRSTNMSPMSNSANSRENRMPTKAKATRPMGESTRSTKSTAKATPRVKDTSFKKSGVAGVLKSPEAKKFRDTFNKKGLFPALRGK
jgi:hypothetical protein